MPMIQLIYASQPLGFDVSDLRAILVTSRRCNERDDVTGALICRADLYLQLLEGPQEMVDAAFQRIARDRRHVGVKVCAGAKSRKDCSRVGRCATTPRDRGCGLKVRSTPARSIAPPRRRRWRSSSVWPANSPDRRRARLPLSAHLPMIL